MVRKKYVVPGAKIKTCVPDEPVRSATVIKYRDTVQPSKYNFYRGGRVFTVEYRNGKIADVNERWIRKQ